jgi:hypothetical protein
MVYGAHEGGGVTLLRGYKYPFLPVVLTDATTDKPFLDA